LGRLGQQQRLCSDTTWLVFTGNRNCFPVSWILKQKDRYQLFQNRITLLKLFLNNADCWNGNAYRYINYKDSTDDRANALMVMSGVADTTKYPAMKFVFSQELHASPWMERFVLESLIKMERRKKRWQE
jgi:hypothetical protein